MTELLVKIFIKNPNDIKNPCVREKYGTLSSIVGIICNIALFSLKYVMGTLSNSIAVTSDAFNNLSDAASCIVTLLGCKMAAKPADKEHPFGHGRMEYLISLIIASVILFMGFELLKNSFGKILHPEAVESSAIILVSLIASIGIKLWMSLFNTKLGKTINSPVMLSTARDSRSDVIATSAAVISIICSAVTDHPIDGIMGIAVSIFILKSGIDIIRDTVDELLGKPADPEVVREIMEIFQADKRIIGIHDLMLHSYGPGNMIGSCHAEFRSGEDFVSVHDLVDCIEREIYKRLRIEMTIHMDPIETENVLVNQHREMLCGILSGIHKDLHCHDFRIVTGDSHTNLIFSLTVPFDLDMSDDQLKTEIDSALSLKGGNFYTVISFERCYTG